MNRWGGYCAVRFDCTGRSGRSERSFGLDALASLVCRQGMPEQAIRLDAAACALLQALGTSPGCGVQQQQEMQLAEMRAKIGNDAFATLRDQGQAMTLEEAVACAALN